MDIYQYKEEITRISHWKGEIYKAMEFQINCNNEILKETIDYRKAALNEHDLNFTLGYLDLGVFKYSEEDFRIACFCVAIEAEYQRKLNKEIVDCSGYEGTEPIFQKQVLREIRNQDLVDYRFFEYRDPSSNIFRTHGFWGYFDKRIPLQIYSWIDNCFVDKPCRIRIEPEGVYDNKPKQMIIECMIIPPQFRWWDRLNIYIGNTTGSEYTLLGNDLNNYRDYWEYNVLNLRRLEVSETRRNEDYISMMIEEIEEHTNPLNSSEKYLIGRMIHLDSSATIGTCFENVILNHIDLAYNLYINGDADNRLRTHLCYGRTQDATHRTHILRIENIPFKSLFKIAYSFFKSKELTTEWLNNEFTN